MKKTVRRTLALASVAVVGIAALGMFAGCTTKRPEITITYTFNGKDYAVDYTLSRNDAPQTVQHFIELADAGFYDGMVIHDYQSSGLYTGGYYLDEDADGGLREVNYLEAVKALEEEKGIAFRQSVWTTDGEPLYAVYGEFESNGVFTEYGRDNSYSQGALVMYYTDKGNFNGDVKVVRADDGSEQISQYKYNSATSLFYTYTGSTTTNTDYCVFGKASNYSEQMSGDDGLLTAISEYIADLEEEERFTETVETYRLNRYDPFVDVRNGDVTADYAFPRTAPIVIKSIVVNKY